MGYNSPSAMRIAVVNESFDERRGGAERCASRVAEALSARGHDVRRISRAPESGRIAGALALAREAARARLHGEVVVSLCRAPGDVVCPQEGVHLAAVRGSLRRFGPVARGLAAMGKLLSPRQWAFLATEAGRHEVRPRRYVALSRRIREDMMRLWNAP